MLIEIWCRVFTSSNVDNIATNLESIRTLVSISGKEDIEIFNRWAEKTGIPVITLNQESESKWILFMINWLKL